MVLHHMNLSQKVEFSIGPVVHSKDAKTLGTSSKESECSTGFITKKPGTSDISADVHGANPMKNPTKHQFAIIMMIRIAMIISMLYICVCVFNTVINIIVITIIVLMSPFSTFQTGPSE